MHRCGTDSSYQLLRSATVSSSWAALVGTGRLLSHVSGRRGEYQPCTRSRTSALPATVGVLPLAPSTLRMGVVQSGTSLELT